MKKSTGVIKQSKVIKVGSKYLQLYSDGLLIDLTTKKRKPFKPNLYGFLKTCVWDSKQQKNINVYLHRILANNFIPKPPKAYKIKHINGNKLDNRLSNLKWE